MHDQDMTKNTSATTRHVVVRWLAMAASALFFAGCAAEVVPAGPDTYTVAASGAGFSSAGVRASVYKTANEFCAKRGLVMVPVSFDVKDGELGRRPPSAELVFRALRPGDPEIKRPNIEGPNFILRVQNR